MKRDAVQIELLTVDVATLGDGLSTRYRAELNVKLPGLDTMTPDDVKKTIDTVIADPAIASAVESKTVKLGMSLDEVKQSLGNADKIVDLGTKQVLIYKDMKVILIDGKVADVHSSASINPRSIMPTRRRKSMPSVLSEPVVRPITQCSGPYPWDEDEQLRARLEDAGWRYAALIGVVDPIESQCTESTQAEIERSTVTSSSNGRGGRYGTTRKRLHSSRRCLVQAAK